MVALYKAVD